VRLIVGWTGMALVYMTPVLVIVLTLWFFRRLARRDVRVAVAQGLVVTACAIGVFGVGLAVISLDSPPLVPLGLGSIGLSLAIGTYGIRFFRMRS
jgi:hypothetical protein